MENNIISATTAERDAFLEKLWKRLGDIPVDNEECIKEDLKLDDGTILFDSGTHREDVWLWFDQRYSKGVSALMFTNPKAADDNIVKTAMKAYISCETEECYASCRFANEGRCYIPIIKRRKPNRDDNGECMDHIPTGACELVAEGSKPKAKDATVLVEKRTIIVAAGVDFSGLVDVTDPCHERSARTNERPLGVSIYGRSKYVVAARLIKMRHEFGDHPELNCEDVRVACLGIYSRDHFTPQDFGIAQYKWDDWEDNDSFEVPQLPEGDWSLMCEVVGVDSGTAGFFPASSRVPDMNKAQLNDLWAYCESDGPWDQVFQTPYGICSRSGYGDGVYPVYYQDSNHEIVAMEMAFIESEDVC